MAVAVASGAGLYVSIVAVGVSVGAKTITVDVAVGFGAAVGRVITWPQPANRLTIRQSIDETASRRVRDTGALYHREAPRRDLVGVPNVCIHAPGQVLGIATGCFDS